jgi:hypothetical protein
MMQLVERKTLCDLPTTRHHALLHQGFRPARCRWRRTWPPPPYVVYLRGQSQGPHIGFRSAAAAGRFLQARRRAALAPGQPAGDGHPEAASVSQNGAGEEAPRPLAPARALSASSEASFLDGAEATSFAGAATTATPGGAAGMAAFARRLARSSRLVFFNDNLGG